MQLDMVLSYTYFTFLRVHYFTYLLLEILKALQLTQLGWCAHLHLLLAFI